MSQLEYLRNRSLIMIDFMLEKNSKDLLLIEFKKVLNDTYEKKNERGMKMLSRDINAWVKGMSRKDISELETIFKDKFGENLAGDKITHLIIKKVIKKGEIEDQETFRVVYEYIQDISEEDSFYSKVSVLEAMLGNYIDK